ncbi:hypothetical protein [Microbacterium sp. PM5]|uniref:hypothetical protein n=1 Tax=Microbacterium sp. PM5 TaxID=2014534 RepID=UPI000DD14682|nr:hypothetical protein [Microbacterium sp. PM5]AXA97774.1 hypothetical protein CEP17_09270 [Microbacterium sp. PM5]
MGEQARAAEAGTDAATRPSPARRRSRRLAFDLAALSVVGLLLVGAIGAATVTVYRDLYSPGAFVTRYLSLLSEGRVPEALALPGVPIASSDLTDAGLPGDASEALLRRAALAPLSDIRVVGEQASDGVELVTVSYQAGPHAGTSTFRVERAGWVGLAPTWRFAQSPLAVIDLTLRGATAFSVNGFAVDTRQVSPDGTKADPLAPVALLVFSPGLYSISVDTPVSSSPGVAVLSDTPQAEVPVDIQTQPTSTFVDVVQERVESFLTACTTQQVLQPTGCPFGLQVRNRILEPPVWSMVTPPKIALRPDGAGWSIVPADAAAHVVVDIKSIFDGTVTHVDEDVPFRVGGTITMLPDGTASIQVQSAG